MTKAVLAVLALGASTWVIIAQQNGGPGPGAQGDPGGPGLSWQSSRGGIRLLPPFFRALDVNQNGVIDAEEIANAPAALRTLLKHGSDSLTMEDLMGQSTMLAHGPDRPGVKAGPGSAGTVDLTPGRPGGPNGSGGPGGPPQGDH